MKNKRNVSAQTRLRVMKRDKFKCTYCGASGNNTELEVDHIIPVSKGGSNHISNLTTACLSCNREKSDCGIFIKKQLQKEYYHCLIGKPIHLLKDGKIENQGVIIGNDKGDFIVQRYSFFDGHATDIIPVHRDALLDTSQCKIYNNDEQWHNAYYEQMETS